MDEAKTMTEEAISFGFRKSKSYFGFFAIYLICIGIISLVFMGAAVGLAVLLDGWAKLVGIVPFLIYCPIALAIGLMSLNLCAIVNRGEKPSFGALWPGTPKAINFIKGAVIYAVIVGVGYIFLIIPGIYLAVKYQFFAMFILDKDTGPLDAIKMSGEITKGNWGDCFWLVIEQGIICFLGALALGLGLFWAVPTALVSHGFAYTRLVAEPAMAAAQPARAVVPSAAPAE